MLNRKQVETLKQWPKTNGYSIINFCPGCMTQVWTQTNAERIVDIIRALGKGLEKRNQKKRRKLEIDLNKRVRKGSGNVFGLFVAESLELARALDYRVIVYPVCRDCEPYVGDEDWEDWVETNLEGSRYSVPVVNIDQN